LTLAAAAKKMLGLLKKNSEVPFSETIDFCPSTYPGNPMEALSREQAVIAYTLTSAHAEFVEKDKGALSRANSPTSLFCRKTSLGFHRRTCPRRNRC
jgi:hypothetical protein